MESYGTHSLVEQVAVNSDGVINQKEFFQRTSDAVDEGIGSFSTSGIASGTSTVSGYGHYGADSSFRTVADKVYDRIDLNHNDIIERREIDLNRNDIIERNEINHFVSEESADADASSTTNIVSRYPTDGRGFFLDLNPQIITRPSPIPPPTYKQNITIRYLQPPPLPPPGDNIIREVRSPPLEAPPPFLIREPGKPGYQPPPLILRERPPSPPPAIRPFVKIVTIPPLPAPPRSTIIEKFPDLPDAPHDVILERWLPYGPRPPSRTVRIRAPDGPLPRPPRNQIIQYLPLQPRIVRQFKRLIVVRADPQAYIEEYGSSLLDSATFVDRARAAGVAEDISLPASTVGFASLTYGEVDGLTRSYRGDTSGYITNSSADYSGSVGSDRIFSRHTFSKQYPRGVGFDVHGDTIDSVKISRDGTQFREVEGYLEQRL